MQTLLFSLIALLTFSHAPGKQTQSTVDSTAQTYCNARFGYCINYPDELLIPQEEAQNGDGRKFINKGGKVILTVFGRINQDANGDPITLSKQMANDIAEIEKKPAGGNVTYKKAGKDFYVLSGTKNGKLFYHKMIIKEEAFCFALLEYDQKEKDIYNKYAQVIFNTFK